MTDPRSPRFAGIAALAAVVCFIVAFAVFFPSGAPSSGDGGDKVLSFVSDHRSKLLASLAFNGLAALFFGVLIAGVYYQLRHVDGPASGWGLVGLVGGVASGGVFLAGLAVQTALVYRAPTGNPALARAMLDIGWVALNMSGFFLFLFVAGTALGMDAARLAPRAMCPIGLLVAACQLAGGVTFARGNGFMSPQGGFAFIAFIAFAVWALLLGLVLLRGTEAVRAAPATPATA
jgi:hypothetical protein